ncbi:leucine--tRNA ligase [Hujiaoplasma nucleasis]|uniref:Leucine--tRNA ligase n=1 Tax=Hujiaoplasma nucleasis TaxID=2725268 RepID=A0A7L6N1A8_9MOLU|nr:leucine--tRNA ligase [Hujiaoplasma nucleasis]QLY40036.1 leucine--tRNA ligase [Hujiaoplasma nucleasis]
MSEFIPSFEHEKIEKKWQDKWYSKDYFKAIDFSDKPKYYSLVEFPYPSGMGMHIGHIRAYLSLEVISRKRRMEGYNVLFPIGFDAFGLPTENYAIKTQIHPRKITDQNIETFKNQLKSAGISFDFSRVVDTTDPEYYKWTQWIFLKMFENGLVFKDKTYVNYCPSCQVVLSNEESQGGKCDRCDTQVTQMEKDVWFLKITNYANDLLEGLKDLESNERIKTEQERWIGKSVGANLHFPIKDSDRSLEVFTTRPDTIYGATFMVIAPEHPYIEVYKDRIKNMDEVIAYQEQAKMKTEFERVELVKDKTGVKLEGLVAINPISKEEIPIFISDYVMITYGTGAIMAVPAHDTRDYDFAKKYDLKILEVIQGGNIEEEAFTDTETGVLVNSPLIDGLSVKEAKEKILDIIEKEKIGNKAIQFKMKDWAFNRQRYWGEPIPIIYCDQCGIVPVPYEDLPVTLPYVEKFSPSSTGESPLASIDDYVQCTCPKCQGKARRETDTMPQWAGSSWYFLRYMDPFNQEEFASMDKLKYWGQVDWYNGGMEHVTRHLIYSRFWNQFLNSIGLVPNKEPYKKRTAQGLILGSDNEKMSKSRGNVVNPMEIIDEYGADTLRTFVLFLSDYEMSTPWNDDGVKGARRFLDKIWRMFPKVTDQMDYSKALERDIHLTIKGFSEDVENLKFNTAIAKLMELVNLFNKEEEITRADYQSLLKLLYPIAPHIAEELWQMLGHDDLLVFESFPEYDERKLVKDQIELVLSVNGKVRDKLTVENNLDKESLEKIALDSDKIQAYIEGKTVVKVIVVPNKLVNIVIK